MADLKNTFRQLLPKKIKGLKFGLNQISSAESSDQAEESIRRILHSLKNTASSFGYEKIGTEADRIDELSGEDFYRGVENFITTVNSMLDLNQKKNKKNILIIDDDELTIELINSILPKSEYNIIQVENKLRAQTELLENDISLIIMDIILPDIDGRDVLAELKSQPNTMPIPIIILSDEDIGRIREECLALGAEKFITKPFDINDLVDLVESTSLDEPAIQIVTNLLSKKKLIKKFNSLQRQNSDIDPYTLTLLDIDNLNEIEEKFAQKEINKILNEFNQFIQEEIIIEKYYCHWYGEEYLLFFPDIKEKEAMQIISDFYQYVRDNPIELDKNTAIETTFSAGSKQFQYATDIQDAYFKVSEILNQAREKGTGQILCSSKCREPEKKKIILAENDEITNSLITHRLERENYEVKFVTEGKEVLNLLQDDPSYSMIIINIKLQEMSGFEIIEKLKNKEATQDIPIIILTSMGKEHDIIHGLETGADDYIVKPFSPRELVARVQRLSRRKN